MSLLPAFLLALAFLVLAHRLLRRPKPFALHFQEALEKKKHSTASVAVKRENLRAAKNARRLTTECLPAAAPSRAMINILISEETADAGNARRSPAVQSPARLDVLAYRLVAALPQRSPEQKMLLVQDTLYLFSRGLAVFAMKVGEGDSHSTWSPPLAILPDSGPGFSVTFWDRWFFFAPGAEHRNATPLYRSERYADGSLGPWEIAGEIPVGLGQHALAAGRNSLFLIGGRTRKGKVAWVFQVRLDPIGYASRIARAWSLPRPTCPARCARVRNRLFVWKGPLESNTGEDIPLCSAAISADDQLAAWRHRGTLPETAGAEGLYLKGEHLLLIQRGHLYQTAFQPGGPLGPWHRLEGRLPRRGPVLLLADHLLIAATESARCGNSRPGHALFTARVTA